VNLCRADRNRPGTFASPIPVQTHHRKVKLMSLLVTRNLRGVTVRPARFRSLTIAAIVLLGLTVIWGFADTRTIEGIPVWMKPLKFALSFAMLFGTVALVETRLSDRERDGSPMRIAGWVMATAFLFEMGYMIFQAAHAEASHFNRSTPFHEFIYSAMGGGAVALVVATATIGWVVKRDKTANLSPTLREAIWLGFLLTFVSTMIVAGYMGSGAGHFVGVHPEDAPTIPLFGWSGVTGDLRPAHFVSLHAMQALPLLAICLDRVGQGTNSVRSVRIAAVGYLLLTLALFTQALMGLPLLPLS
jgi:hypothetical protein